MSATAGNSVTELVEKIHQFLAHQIETNTGLSSSARESLNVANECIEQAYNIQKKPASNELLDLYTKSQQQQQQQSSGATDAAQTNPAQFIQNLASQILNSATASATTNGAAGAATAGQAPAPNPANLAAAAAQVFSQAFATPTNTQPQQPDVTSTAAPQQQQPEPQQQQQQQQQTPPPRQRKRATEAERIAAESFKNQGNDLMKQDRYKEAYDCYTQAIQIDENNAVYYSNRAAASSKMQDHQAALRDCQEAVEVDPNYGKAYGRMGLAYASLGDHKSARDAYKKAVRLDPNNESYKNNLFIAEEKLAAQAAGGAGQQQSASAGGNPLGEGLQNNMMGMLRNMMGNPELMQMAMQSLRDPRMQSLFGMAAGAMNPNGNNPNQQQPPNTHS